ncbi:hypothetical protein HDV00_003249 [Rhizophlyctis rosea]|nr:hypothetical protein HDV00_003249 [Rhizophlyctis rosea]
MAQSNYHLATSPYDEDAPNSRPGYGYAPVYVTYFYSGSEIGSYWNVGSDWHSGSCCASSSYPDCDSYLDSCSGPDFCSCLDFDYGCCLVTYFAVSCSLKDDRNPPPPSFDAFPVLRLGGALGRYESTLEAGGR